MDHQETVRAWAALDRAHRTPDLGPCQYGRALVDDDDPEAAPCPHAGEELLAILDDDDSEADPMHLALCLPHMDRVQRRLQRDAAGQ